MGACCSAGGSRAGSGDGEYQQNGTPYTRKGRRYHQAGREKQAGRGGKDGDGAADGGADYLKYTDKDSADDWDSQGESDDGARGGRVSGVDISFAGNTLLGHVDLNSLEDRLPREDAEDHEELFPMAQLKGRGVYATLVSEGCSDPVAIAKLMTSLRSIKAVSTMPEEIVRMLAQHMVLVSVPAGSVLVDKGDIFSLIYVVNTGVLERGEETGVSKASRLSHVARLSLIKEMSGPWEVVGQVGNLVGGRSPCNVFARVDSEIWMIEREAVLKVCANHTRERSEKLLDCLNRVPLLNVLTEGERERLAGVMEMVEFDDGETIFEAGDPADALYVIVQGSVEYRARGARTDGAEGEGGGGGAAGHAESVGKVGTVVHHLEGQAFGELCLVKNNARDGTCIARADAGAAVAPDAASDPSSPVSANEGGSPASASAKRLADSCIGQTKIRCMRLTRSEFDMILGPMSMYLNESLAVRAPSADATGTTDADAVCKASPSSFSNAYEVRVLRETPGLQNLSPQVANAIAKRGKRYAIPAGTVFGLTNPAESLPSTPKHAVEDMQTLKVYYNDFQSSFSQVWDARESASSTNGAPSGAETAREGGGSGSGLSGPDGGASGPGGFTSQNADAQNEKGDPHELSERHTDSEFEDCNRETMPGLFIVSQGEAGIVIGKGLDVLLGHLSSELGQDSSSSPVGGTRAGELPAAASPMKRMGSMGRGTETEAGEAPATSSARSSMDMEGRIGRGVQRRSSRRNTEFKRALREKHIRDTLTHHSAASLTKGLQKGSIVRGHVIGLQHIIFNSRPTLMKSKTPMEYLFIPREVVEEYAVPLLEAFDLSQPSTKTVTTFLNETPVLDKLLNKDIQKIAMSVQRIFLRKGDVLAYEGNAINSCYYVSHGRLSMTTEKEEMEMQETASQNLQAQAAQPAQAAAAVTTAVAVTTTTAATAATAAAEGCLAAAPTHPSSERNTADVHGDATTASAAGEAEPSAGPTAGAEATPSGSGAGGEGNGQGRDGAENEAVVGGAEGARDGGAPGETAPSPGGPAASPEKAPTPRPKKKRSWTSSGTSGVGGSSGSGGGADSGKGMGSRVLNQLSWRRSNTKREKSSLFNHPMHIFSSTSAAGTDIKRRRKKNSLGASGRASAGDGAPVPIAVRTNKYDHSGLIMFQDALKGEVTSDATYCATSFTVILALHRSKLEKRLGDTLMKISNCDETEFRLRVLQSIPMLSPLDEKEQRGMASAMKLATFEPGEYIIVQGDPGEHAYIIRSGECVVTITVPSRSKRASRSDSNISQGTPLNVRTSGAGWSISETSADGGGSSAPLPPRAQGRGPSGGRPVAGTYGRDPARRGVPDRGAPGGDPQSSQGYDGDEEENSRLSNLSVSSYRSADTSDSEVAQFRASGGLNLVAGTDAGGMGSSHGSGHARSAAAGSATQSEYASDEIDSDTSGRSSFTGKDRRWGRSGRNARDAGLRGGGSAAPAAGSERLTERRMSELQIAQLSRGHFFGESALHEKKPRNANVLAKTTVECYVISSRLFNKHLSSLSNDINDRSSRNMQYREEKLKQYYTGSHFESGMSMKDVEIVGFLGKGIVGQVVLVRTKVGEHYYAVKCINKSFVVKNEMAADVVAEMKLLKSLRSPFLSHMLFSDRDPEYVFMGFNMLPGGNLYARLRRHGPMSEEQCKFYVAGIINALDFLHQRNIAHRDVKPENIVLDRYGYPVLIDFGCARSILKQSMTICGTPLYVAPEVLTCKGHTTAVDCWSFGVLVYELLTMSTPFKTNQDETVDDVYENIIDCCYSMPDYVSAEASDLIHSLLQVKVGRRLGALRGKWMDVRSHSFFNGFDQQRVASRSIDAPWVPDFHRVVKKAIDNSERAKLVYKKRRNRSVIEQCAEKLQSGGKDWDSVFSSM